MIMVSHNLSWHILYFYTDFNEANLPNLRRLFVEARTDAEESAYSRNAVSENWIFEDVCLTANSSTIS